VGVTTFFTPLKHRTLEWGTHIFRGAKLEEQALNFGRDYWAFFQWKANAEILRCAQDDGPYFFLCLLN
jgi:hypothetical protein